MTKKLTQKQIEVALSSAVVEKLMAIDVAGTGETALMTLKELLTIFFDIADSAEVPRQMLALEIRKIAELRLPLLPEGPPTWVQSEGEA